MSAPGVAGRIWNLWPPNAGGAVCFTGGEPLMQEQDLINVLNMIMGQYDISIETNGSLDIKTVAAPVQDKSDDSTPRYNSYRHSESRLDNYIHIVLDFKTPSSGMARYNRYENVEWVNMHLDEIKFVIADRNDYEFARDVIETMNLGKMEFEILMSPVFQPKEITDCVGITPQENASRFARSVVNWILHDQLPVRLQLQLHKIIWPGKTRGV